MRKNFKLIIIFALLIASLFMGCHKKGPNETKTPGNSSKNPTTQSPSTTPSETTTQKELPYYIYIEKGSNTLTVYSKNESGEYTKPEKSFKTALGLETSKTPSGTFELADFARWHKLPNGKFVQYASSLRSSASEGSDSGSALVISSALYDTDDINTLVRESYITIGGLSTDGSVYTTVDAAKWINENCPEGTKVEIVEGSPKGNTADAASELNTDYYFTDPTDPLRPGLKAEPSYDYKVYIEKGSFTITVYAKDEDGNFEKSVKTWLTASGKTAGRTPTGTFQIEKKERWHTFPKPFIGGFAQFASYFHENLMIHSPVYGLKDNQYMVADSYYEIGTMSTAGCLRTTTEAAYWIYTYCPEGTEVEIVNGSPKEMSAEEPPKPSAGFPWMDPTDPFRPVSKWNELSSLNDSVNNDFVYVTDSFPASGTVKLPEGMNSIPIRDGPGENEKTIGYLSNGTTVTVINKFEPVCEINFFNSSAYIDKQYIAIGQKYIMPYTEKLYVAALSATELPAFNTEVNELLKNELVDVRSLDDTIEIDMLFASESNFASEKLYPCQVCLIQKDTGAKLVEAQKLFLEGGFRIKIYDAYRPYTVQGKLYDIVQNSAYIANPATTASRHNRGTALDMTIVDSEGNELAMATPVHTFGPGSRIDNPGMTEEQKANLAYMQSVMTKCGFVTYNYEWWHFSDANSLDYMVTDYDLAQIIYSN